MAGITPNGWETITQQGAVEELQEAMRDAFGEDFPTTPDSEVGQFLNIFAEREKRLYDLGQAITDTQNLSTAEGLYLDYLAEHKGTRRFGDAGSFGLVNIVAPQNTTFPASTAIKDEISRVVLTQDEVTTNRSNCYTSTFQILEVQNNSEYLIAVEGIDYSYTSDPTATVEEIVAGLEAALAAGSTVFSTVVENDIFTLTNLSRTNTLTTNNSVNLSLTSVGVLVQAIAADTGPLSFPAGTVNSVVDNTLGAISASNPLDFTLGRSEETDPELRARLVDLDEQVGTATKPSMEASLAQVNGVTGVLLLENKTDEVDGNGIPPHEFEMFISGGDEQEIAEKIFNVKPAGIRSHGDITVPIIDGNGDPQVENFSRKTTLVAWVRVTYEINDEEDFPANGEQAMSEAVVNFGNSMYSGEDLVANKFMAPLYTIQGVFILNVEIAVTNTINDTPVYQTARIPVAEVQELVFSDASVTITT